MRNFKRDIKNDNLFSVPLSSKLKIAPKYEICIFGEKVNF